MISAALPVNALSGGDPPRRRGDSLKRKQVEFSEDDNLTSSQSKRQKVSFDPQIEVRVLQDWDAKPLELVREEVRQAIQRRLAGDNGLYDQVKQLLTTPPSAEDAPSTSLVQKYLVALLGNVNSLGRPCAGLVHALLDCQWLGRDDSFVALYVRLLGTIASAHGGYIAAVLRMLVEKLANPSGNRLRNHAVVKRSQMQSRVHQALKFILRLVPSASGPLSSVLTSFFPFSTDTTKSHVAYIQNLLKIIEYAPELKGEVITLIIERLVKIDVQIQVDMEDIEDELEETLLQNVAGRYVGDDQAEDSDDSDNDSVSSSEMTVDPEEQRLKELRAAIAKMDAILDLLFNFYTPTFAKGSVFEVEESFEQLLSNFSNTLIPTYRSRHTQFLLFHFAQVSPSLIDRFAGTCAQLAFERSRPQLLRHAAAAYLGSFVARGAHVSTEVVREIFDILGSELERMRANYELSCRGPDLKRYGGYYAVVQAMLYIFCFRWRDFVASGDNAMEEVDDTLLDGGDLIWTPGIKEVLLRNIYCKLNPLKVCSPVIVSQFARIAHHLRFLYVYPLLETNKRIRLSRFAGSGASYGGVQERETALSGKTAESAFQLDAYFPFDPYHLPRSKRWLEGDYVDWKTIPGMKDGAEEDEEDGAEADDGLGDDEEGEGDDGDDDDEADDGLSVFSSDVEEEKDGLEDVMVDSESDGDSLPH